MYPNFKLSQYFRTKKFDIDKEMSDVSGINAYVCKGDEFFEKGDYAKACDFYTDALGCGDDWTSIQVYVKRTLAFMKMERYEEAKEDADKAIDLEDRTGLIGQNGSRGFSTALLLSGKASFYLGRYEEAKKCFVKGERGQGGDDEGMGMRQWIFWCDEKIKRLGDKARNPAPVNKTDDAKFIGENRDGQKKSEPVTDSQIFKSGFLLSKQVKKVEPEKQAKKAESAIAENKQEKYMKEVLQTVQQACCKRSENTSAVPSNKDDPGNKILLRLQRQRAARSEPGAQVVKTSAVEELPGCCGGETPDHATPAPPPPHPDHAAEEVTDARITRDWYQTETQVVIEIRIKKLAANKVKVDIGETDLSVTAKLPDRDTEYSLEVELAHPVMPAQSSYKVMSTKIEIKLKKAEGVRWSALEGDGSAPLPGGASTAKSPYASHKDWSAIEKHLDKEVEEKKEEDVGELLQKMHVDGSYDNIKKIMNKSFQESLDKEAKEKQEGEAKLNEMQKIYDDCVDDVNEMIKLKENQYSAPAGGRSRSLRTPGSGRIGRGHRGDAPGRMEGMQ